MSDSVRPHRRQPTRLPRPWDSPGKDWSGLPFPSPMCESEVAQSCSTLSDTMDYSLPGSSVHGIFQARVPEWGANSSSGTPIIRMLVHLRLSQRSLSLCSVLFILFTLFCSSAVISTILSSSSLIHYKYGMLHKFACHPAQGPC